MSSHTMQWADALWGQMFLSQCIHTYIHTYISNDITSQAEWSADWKQNHLSVWGRRVYCHTHIYIQQYIHYQSKVSGYPQKFLFLIQKVLILMKQVKCHNVFIYYTKYKPSSVTLTLVSPGIFWKNDLKAFFFFSMEHGLQWIISLGDIRKWDKTRPKATTRAEDKQFHQSPVCMIEGWLL